MYTRNKISIADVARLAGVSTATVSFVLNNTKAVTPDVQRRVEAAVQSLGYRPSHAAQALRTGKSLTIGLIIPDLTNPFFPKLAQDIEQEARARGYAVLLADSHDDAELQREHLRNMECRGVDLLLIVPAVNSSHTLISSVPLIALDREAGETPVVQSNKWQGGALAAQHLLELGHQKFAVLAGPFRRGGPGERVRGMTETLEKAGFPVRAERVFASDYSIAAGRQGTAHLLANAPGFTALLAANDTLALGALGALGEAGISVPNQMSLTGFDDISWAALSSPPLTTIRQDTRQMARRAIDQALQMAKLPFPAAQATLTTLVVRGSTAVAISTDPENRINPEENI